MEDFKRRVKRRVRMLEGALVVLLLVMIAVGELSGRGVLLDSRQISQLAGTASRILFFGSVIWVIFRIVKNKKLLKNKDLLLDQKIEENDERLCHIWNLSGGVAIDVLLFIMIATTFFLAFVSMPAFYTAFFLLAATVLLKLGL